MKKLIILVCLALFALSSIAFAGQTSVRGYYKSNGTYVAPHVRTTPNSSRMDNYSYPGNYNPNKGAITPYSTSPRQNYPSNPNPYDQDKVKNPYRFGD